MKNFLSSWISSISSQATKGVYVVALLSALSLSSCDNKNWANKSEKNETSDQILLNLQAATTKNKIDYSPISCSSWDTSYNALGLGDWDITYYKNAHGTGIVYNINSNTKKASIERRNTSTLPAKVIDSSEVTDPNKVDVIYKEVTNFINTCNNHQ